MGDASRAPDRRVIAAGRALEIDKLRDRVVVTANESGRRTGVAGKIVHARPRAHAAEFHSAGVYSQKPGM